MMKKGGLNFLSRRNQSLFDTKVPMKDIESVEFVYDAVVIPDSGTAKVRSRPTVKHFSTFGDGAGFAVPTPTVPDLPSFTTPQISHTGNTVSLSNGSAISVDDTEEEQILIPPPPSIAPPPPPPQFIPPPPGHVTPPSAFFDDPYSPVDLSTLEPPPMPPPKPPSQGMSEDVDLSMLKPPSMAPPKPPQISSSSPEDIPECPKFTPPQPPAETSQIPISKVQKMPPPKPMRFSSMSNFELPSSGSITPTSTALEKPAASSQNTGQLYSVPKTTILTGLSDRENKTQHILPPENSSKNSFEAYINGKAPASEKEMSTPQNLTPPIKPVRRNSSGIKLEENLQHLKENMQMTLPATPARAINSTTATVETPSDVPNKILTQIKDSPTTEKQASVLSAQDIIHLTPVDPMRKYSPLLNHKLQNLKTNEPPGGKEVAASPFALLMAAKEREKQKAATSRKNSTKSNSSLDSTNESIHPSDTKPNLLNVTPNPPDTSRNVSPFMKANSILEPSIPSSSTQNKNSSSIPSPPSTAGQYNGFDAISFIPPPPEFANSDPEDEAPQSRPPPDLPTKKTGVIPLLNTAPISNTPSNKTPSTTTQINAVSNTQSKPKSQVTPPSQPKTQPQAPPPSQPKTQPQAPPQFQPKIQPQVLPPPQPKFQPQTPPPPQPKFQPQTPPQPKFQPQTLPPPQLKFQSKTPPPIQPKFQPQTPPQPKFQTPPQPKFQPQTPPQPKFQPQPPPQPRFQPQPQPTPQAKFQPQVQPPPQPKFQPHTPTQFQPKTQPQTPPSVAANQATLLSILQKKMLEMDPKFAPVHEADTGSDDWNSPQFDEDVGGGPSLNFTPKPKSSNLSAQPAGLDMKELESKVTKKAQAKAPASSSSKQQFGMTFIVRPGTKQPITPIPKTE